MKDQHRSNLSLDDLIQMHQEQQDYFAQNLFTTMVDITRMQAEAIQQKNIKGEQACIH